MKVEDLFTKEQKEIILNDEENLILLKKAIKKLTYRLPFKEGDEVCFNSGSAVKCGIITCADHYNKKYYINSYNKEGFLSNFIVGRAYNKVWEGVKNSKLCKPCLFFAEKTNVHNAKKTSYILQ